MLLGIIDRILFTAGVLLFLQLPAFIDQYTHRLGGFQRGFNEQISNFQAIADNNFNGELAVLIRHFKTSDMPSVRETAQTIEYNVSMNQSIQADLAVLQNQPLTKKALYLVTHMRYELGKDTLHTFNPSIPLNPMAFVYGLLGGILSSGLFYLIFRLPIAWIKQRRKQPQNPIVT